MGNFPKLYTIALARLGRKAGNMTQQQAEAIIFELIPRPSSYLNARVEKRAVGENDHIVIISNFGIPLESKQEVEAQHKEAFFSVAKKAGLDVGNGNIFVAVYQIEPPVTYK
jgi:hypothetical protein